MLSYALTKGLLSERLIVALMGEQGITALDAEVVGFFDG